MFTSYWTSGFFYIDEDIKGSVTPSQFTQTQTLDDSDNYKDGEIIESWDHVFRWDEDCVSQSYMKDRRFESDDLADAALPVVTGPAGKAGGTDMFTRLEAAVEGPNPSPEVTALWEQLHGIESAAINVDIEQIRRGQAVFYRYAPQILASLLQNSLAFGFSAPRIARVMNMTSYLCPPMESTPEGEAPRISKASNDRTYMRLMETTQFVLDCMGDKDAMQVGGQGWREAVRVRLLHTTMRKRVVEKITKDIDLKGSCPAYQHHRDGVPISQEDLMVTLSSFTGHPMLCVRKCGIKPSPQELEDYVAVWKVIGYYLGINTSLLEAHFSSWHKCSRLTACTYVDLVTESQPPPPLQFPFAELVPGQKIVLARQPQPKYKEEPDPWTAPATLAILLSVCNRWPSPFNFADQCTASRHLIGHRGSDWLSVPLSTLYERVKLRVGFTVLNCAPCFARVYRRGWDAKRNRLMKENMDVAVALQLGSRHTKFRPRKPEAFEPVKEVDEYVAISVWGSITRGLTGWAALYAEAAFVVGCPVVWLVLGLRKGLHMWRAW